MKILDLFCCSGGSCEGAMRVADSVTGIDIRRPSSYPGKFIQMDVTKLTPAYLRKWDFIISSPPCQEWSNALALARMRGNKYPDLIDFTRQLIIQSGVPGFIENVPTAPIKNDLTLCGTMFGLQDSEGNQLIRHRRFELINWHTFFRSHVCKVPTEKVLRVVSGIACWRLYKDARKKNCIEGLGIRPELRRTRWEINQVIPPVYIEWILHRYLNRLTEKKILLNLTTRDLYFEPAVSGRLRVA